MAPRVVVRDAREADLPELARLYADSVRSLGPEHYRREAVAAWAAFAEQAEFRDFALAPWTFVAEDESGILGFAGVDASGHVASLYVRGDRSREGIGSRLLSTILKVGQANGVRHFRAETSEFSRPLFEKFGFSVTRVEVVERHGVRFERSKMERPADRGADGPREDD